MTSPQTNTPATSFAQSSKTLSFMSILAWLLTFIGQESGVLEYGFPAICQLVVPFQHLPLVGAQKRSIRHFRNTSQLEQQVGLTELTFYSAGFNLLRQDRQQLLLVRVGYRCLLFE